MSQEIMRSYNYDMLLPTSICFVIGLSYYYYKYRNTRSNLEATNRIDGNSHSHSRDNVNQAHLNDNNNINQGNVLKLFVMIRGNKVQIDAFKNELVSNFINNKVNPYAEINFFEGDRLKLIFQGRILDKNKKFSDMPNIDNESVLHCYISEGTENINHNNSNLIRNGNRENPNNNNNSQSGQNNHSDANSVSVYTLLFHLAILILITILITFYKIFSDIFTRGVLLILNIMIVIWVIQVSKCLAKVAVYKNIIYN